MVFQQGRMGFFRIVDSNLQCVLGCLSYDLLQGLSLSLDFLWVGGNCTGMMFAETAILIGMRVVEKEPGALVLVAVLLASDCPVNNVLAVTGQRTSSERSRSRLASRPRQEEQAPISAEGS